MQPYRQTDRRDGRTNKHRVNTIAIAVAIAAGDWSTSLASLPVELELVEVATEAVAVVGNDDAGVGVDMLLIDAVKREERK